MNESLTFLATGQPPARAADVDALCRKISDFSRLPEDWAGEGAVAPGPEVIDLACIILRDLPSSASLPQASPSAEGEIGLSWFNGHKRLEAMLYSDGHLVWVKRLEDRFLPGDDINLHERPLGAFFDEVVRFYR